MERDAQNILRAVQLEDCRQYLDNIYTGKEQSERHQLYTKHGDKYLTGGLGPFTLFEDLVGDFLHNFLCK